MRKVRSEQSEGVPGLQIAENHNLGMPKTDRHSTFLYFSIHTSHFIDICKTHMLYENEHGKYMKVTDIL